MDKTPMTVRGHQMLKKALQQMKGVERRKLSAALEEAREHGDLSENAEYDAAKQAQGILEAKIRNIEGKLATAQVVDINKLTGTRVVFGATVTITDMDTDDERTITIVGEDEADADRGLISFSSPLARGLIGKEQFDEAKVKLPSSVKEYEITEVKFVEP